MPTTHVLYLEDDPMFSEVVADALRDRGLTVTACDTFDAAVAAADGTDVCVSDYDLGLGEPRTGLDFLAAYDGRRILFSGCPPHDTPDNVEVFTKSRISTLLDALTDPTT